MWNIRFRIYAHSSFDVFGDKDNTLDALYGSVDGVTERVKASLRPKFGATPRPQIDAFLDTNLAFLAKIEENLKTQLGPKAARGARRDTLLSKMFRREHLPVELQPLLARGRRAGARRGQALPRHREHGRARREA
jgi:hypothetical protein